MRSLTSKMAFEGDWGCVTNKQGAFVITKALLANLQKWINYQLFISQIKRAYYLDVPGKYDELNHRFPKIHVKEFGEFFHESNCLID